MGPGVRLCHAEHLKSRSPPFRAGKGWAEFWRDSRDPGRAGIDRAAGMGNALLIPRFADPPHAALKRVAI